MSLNVHEPARTQCLVWNRDLHCELIVHVDDILCVGGEKELMNLGNELKKKREIKYDAAGPEYHQDKIATDPTL